MRKRILVTLGAAAALALAMSVAYADDELVAGSMDAIAQGNATEQTAPDQSGSDHANTPSWVADVKANGGPPAWVVDLKTNGGPPAWVATQRSPNAHSH